MTSARCQRILCVPSILSSATEAAEPRRILVGEAL